MSDKTYPFREGDEYYSMVTRDDGRTELIWSIWDDVSEEIHDKNPQQLYCTTNHALELARVKPCSIILY